MHKSFKNILFHFLLQTVQIIFEFRIQMCLRLCVYLFKVYCFCFWQLVRRFDRITTWDVWFSEIWALSEPFDCRVFAIFIKNRKAITYINVDIFSWIFFRGYFWLTFDWLFTHVKVEAWWNFIFEILNITFDVFNKLLLLSAALFFVLFQNWSWIYWLLIFTTHNVRICLL